MGKDTRAGRNSSHHIQLALFPRHIACMDRRGHHLFQGTLQVPLPYSLFSRGTGHHSVHTEFSGLLKSDDMEHARNLSLQHKGAVRERAALFVSVTTGNDTGRKGKGLKTQTLANRELQGKVGKRFLSDGKIRPQAVSEKIILAALRYFSRKPCLSGSICRWALVVQRAAKARVFTVKKLKNMQQAIITRQSPAPIGMPVTRRPKVHVPQPAIKLPPRGTTGPVHISKLLNPVLEICRHPDRNRLLAEFFSEY